MWVTGVQTCALPIYFCQLTCKIEVSLAKFLHIIDRNCNIACSYRTSLGASCGALPDHFEAIRSLHQITTGITSKDSLQIVVLDPTNASRLLFCFRGSEIANLTLKMTVDIPTIRPGTQGTDQKLAAANILLMRSIWWALRPLTMRQTPLFI